MTAIVLSIGDELMLGQTVDTNSAWISARLAAAGVAVVRHETVGDDQQLIEAAIRRALECDLVIITGGLGPTADDLTRQALAAVAGVELELRDDWLSELRSFWARRNLPMPEMNRIQAMIPRGATMLWNHKGTASGIAMSITRFPQDVMVSVFALPGPPIEMQAMFESDVAPLLMKRSGGAAIVTRALHVFGVGESAIAEKLGSLMDRKRNPSVGTTASGGVVTVRIASRAASREAATEGLHETEAACRTALGEIVFGSDDQTLAGVVAQLLLERKMRVSVAESCTGGLLAKMLTDIAGSSAYFDLGVVSYSNRMKYERLGVSENILNVHGAVSEPTVLAMATGVRRLARSHVALSISGVAGPSGGTAAKPVGTVCIGLAFGKPTDFSADATTARARTFHFTGDRDMVRRRSAMMALSLLRYHLLGLPSPH